MVLARLCARTRLCVWSLHVCVYTEWLADCYAHRVQQHICLLYTPFACLLARLTFINLLFIGVLAEYGNTSAGSIPLALDAAVRGGSIKKGDVVSGVEHKEGRCGEWQLVSNVIYTPRPRCSCAEWKHKEGMW